MARFLHSPSFIHLRKNQDNETNPSSLLITGFNYDLGSLNTADEPSELNQAFETMFTSNPNFAVLAMLRTFIPFLRFIVSRPEYHYYVPSIIYVNDHPSSQLKEN